MFLHAGFRLMDKEPAVLAPGHVVLLKKMVLRLGMGDAFIAYRACGVTGVEMANVIIQKIIWHGYQRWAPG